MGVHGLWKLLESAGKPINPETLEGKVLAVDISIWLNQAVKGVRDRDGNSVQNAHLLTLFNRLCKLLFFRIKPIFIFDGEAPLLKMQTLASRRQRKEEMSIESKKTNEKLLKTFLKRQVIKAALGNASQEELPSISSVRREEVDDMYVLPALEKEEQSSEEEAEIEWEENISGRRTLQDEMFTNPDSMDIDSEEFALLPAEIKHEILKEMKEFNKRRRTLFQRPPEKSKDFSQYQLAGLLKRNQLNQRMESVEREMAQQGLGLLLGEEDKGHSVETRPLVSEDTGHYILIKGCKDKEKHEEKQPAILPCSSTIVASRRKAEPLWRPVSDSSPERKPSTPPIKSLSPSISPSSSPRNCADPGAPPPSPRTLKAIQAAMMNSSSDDEDGGDQHLGDPPSPRTMLAIQQALSEEQVASSSTVGPSDRKEAVPPLSPVQPLAGSLIISSSEEEVDDSMDKSSGNLQSNLLGDTKQHALNLQLGPTISEVGPTPPDSASSLSSTPDVEEAIGLEQKQEGKAILEPGSFPHGLVLDEEGEKEVSLRSQPSPSPHHSPSTWQEVTHVQRNVSEGRRPAVEEAVERKVVIMEDDSNSEDNFIEVSDLEEVDEEDEGEEEEIKAEQKAGLDEGNVTEQRDGKATPTEHPSEDSPPPEPAVEGEDEAAQHQDASGYTHAEWEHVDLEELVQLESSLQVQENDLKTQMQQQERIATTVTGQMYLESQELLRLFGVPFFVAPMEAEAQCAALEQLDQTHGTITDDSDVWLFGARHVYKNFFTRNKYVEQYQCIDIQNQLGLDQSKLINLAYLLGSDYTEGVPGVGYVTGMEILNEFPGKGVDPLVSFYNWWSEAQGNKKLAQNPNDSKVKKKLRSLQLPPGFPNPAVAKAYLQPTVDATCASFKWGQPQVELIKDFCLSRFGWSSRKSEEVLQPVLKQLNITQTQLRIDSFFRLEQHERQAIRSQRLRRAVTCLKRKDQEDEDEEDRGSDEGCSPAKAKNTGALLRTAEGLSVWGGGFLNTEDKIPSQGGDVEDKNSMCELGRQSVAPVDKPKLNPPKAGPSSSSSSGDDSDSDDKVSMVTARSVFENKPRGRGRRGGRGKNLTKR